MFILFVWIFHGTRPLLYAAKRDSDSDWLKTLMHIYEIV